MTLDKLNAQRDVVKNERRQSVDNQPYGRVGEIFAEHMYPKGHPYSWDVIGSMADLSAASVEDVQNFFKLYYAPNNAAIAVVGDFDPAQAKGWIEKYFGPFQEGKPVTRPAVPVGKLEKPQRLVFEDRVQVPRLYIQWPTVGIKNDDHYALSVLGPVLSGARTARLTKALVYDQQIAANVSARQGTNEDVGEFEITVTPRPGHTLEELETAADAVVQKFLAEGPTQDEVQKVLAPAELSFLSGLQSDLGKANTLLEGATYFNDPAHFKIDFEKRTHVTAQDVLRLAKTYLTPNRIVMSCVPLGKPELASKAAESTKVGETTGGAQ
jgi:zinc protease